MQKGPAVFSSFGKKSKDHPLTKDISLDHKLSFSTTTFAGLALGSTATNKDGVSTLDVGAVYRSKNTTIGLKIDAQSNIALTLVLKKIEPLTNIVASFNLHDFESGKIATTLTFREIAPSTNAIASFRLPALRSSKLELQYFHDHATLTSKLSLNEAPSISISATIGTPTLAMGAKAAYETTSNFIHFALGFKFSTPDSTASLVLGDNGDTIRALYHHRLDVLKKTAAAVEIKRRLSANETDIVVGGCYAYDDRTLVKARLDNCGRLGVALQHKIISKSIVSLSSELDAKALHKTPKFGMAVVLK